MNQLVPIGSPSLPTLVIAAGDQAGLRFLWTPPFIRRRNIGS
jgi:hypothetical protein